jgi:hypothetical protein
MLYDISYEEDYTINEDDDEYISYEEEYEEWDDGTWGIPYEEKPITIEESETKVKVYIPLSKKDIPLKSDWIYLGKVDKNDVKNKVKSNAKNNIEINSQVIPKKEINSQVIPKKEISTNTSTFQFSTSQLLKKQIKTIDDIDESDYKPKKKEDKEKKKEYIYFEKEYEYPLVSNYGGALIGVNKNVILDTYKEYQVPIPVLVSPPTPVLKPALTPTLVPTLTPVLTPVANNFIHTSQNNQRLLRNDRNNGKNNKNQYQRLLKPIKK